MVLRKMLISNMLRSCRVMKQNSSIHLWRWFSSKKSFGKTGFANNPKNKWRFGFALLGGGNILYCSSSEATEDESSGSSTSETPHIVVVGGGIMGSWTTYLLAHLLNDESSPFNYRVTLVDAGHPIRGSWGETRALHVAMEDDVRIKMNMLNVNEYLKLQRESTSDRVLVKKVGRLFVGPEDSMQKMHDLIEANGIPVEFVDEKFMENPKNKSVVDSLQGIQLRSEETGFEGWKTIFSPVGYVLKADAILEHLREKTNKLVEKNGDSVSVLENQKVVSVDREKRTLTVRSSFEDGAQNEVGTELHYDKLLITAGPWTNQLLGSSTMNPPLPQMPVVVSNEQTQNFSLDNLHYSTMPLVTYSDGGYVKTGGDYWFIVGPTSELISDQSQGNKNGSMKIGFHRQGELMDNKDFQLPKFNSNNDEASEINLREKLIEKLPHLRKDIKKGDDAQSFDVDDFILDRAKQMVRERFPLVNEEGVEIVMRCLYQNTPDKEFIVGHPVKGHTTLGDEGDIVIACGFNGGGFQMGPMIARLCIKLLLSEQDHSESAINYLAVGHEPANQDFKLSPDLKMDELLETMKKKFDPSRSTLWT